MKTAIKQDVHQISISRASEFLRNETGGRIFAAFFQKKDGRLRQMNCRVGVKQHLRGGELPYNAKEHGVLTVFDMEIKEYRSIRLDRLVSFNIGNETFIVSD